MKIINEVEKPTYFSILPAKVRYDKTLPSTAKLFYAEITALTNKYGYCFASNRYFAELYGKTEVWASNLIKKLEKKGYIWIFYQGKGKNERYIFTDKAIYEKFKENFNPPLKKTLRGIKENFKGAKSVYIDTTSKTPKKIDRNNIYNNIFLSKDKNGDKSPTKGKKYGNKKVNLILTAFKKYRGFDPTDRQPRRQAWNIYQRFNTFLKKTPHLKKYFTDDFSWWLEKYFQFLKRRDYWDKIESLDAVRRKLTIFFAMVERKIKTQQQLEEMEKEKEPLQVDEKGAEKVRQLREELVKKFSLK